MQNIEKEIERIYKSYNLGEDNVADGLLLNAELKRVEILVHLKELGYQIPDKLLLYPLLDEETADEIIRNTEEMRLNLNNNR